MYSLESMKKRAMIGSLIIALTITLIGVGREYSFHLLDDGLTRPYGSSLSVSIAFIVMLLGTLASKKLRIRVSMKKNAALKRYFLWGMLSVLLLPINGGSIKTYLIAAVRYVQFFVVALLLANYSKEELKGGIRIGFLMGLALQTMIGFLYVFRRIAIPFLTYTGYNGFRNGVLRMSGTFSHPGSFSLYIAVIFVYFLCDFLFQKRRTSFIFVIMAALDLYLSGARAMLLVAAGLSVVILVRKYQHNAFFRFLMIAALAMAAVWFFQSRIYYEMFVINSGVDMLIVRFGHVITGLQIMFRNVINALFGVGLNYHVDYKVNNASMFVWIMSLVAATASDSHYEIGTTIPVHNSFLVAGTELGLMGLFLYARIYYVWIKKSLREIRLNKQLQGEGKGELYFCFAGILTLTFYCMQGWGMHQTHGWFLLMILCELTRRVTEDSMNDRMRVKDGTVRGK